MLIDVHLNQVAARRTRPSRGGPHITRSVEPLGPVSEMNALPKPVLKPAAPLASKARWWWYLSPQGWIRTIVSQDDTPRSIALGAALGTFIAFTPTVGMQMVLVLLIAWLTKPLFRFNQVAALVAVYISNPVTTLPIYWFNYYIGTFFVPGDLTRQQLAELLNYDGFVAWWRSLWALTIEIGSPLVLGSVLVGLCCAFAVYPVIFWLANSLQKKTAKQTA